MPDGVTHDFVQDRLVQANFGRENQGFLLLRGSGQSFHADYVDGVTEQIDPPDGAPRPDPDPAVRTKRVRVPASLQNVDTGTHQHASRYTGQMRRVVQCYYSRGLETVFAYRWQKTHGILEFPFPRQVGSSPGTEALNFAQRRFWLIEISGAGIYAAPVKFGSKCLSCMSGLSDYQPTQDQLREHPEWAQYASEISLAWAYGNRNAGGAVRQVLADTEIAPAYAHGWPWYDGMGWAFSYSGMQAANVVSQMIGDGVDFSAVEDYYETRLVELDFSVELPTGAVSIEITAPNLAHAAAPGHGIAEGGLAIINGADQPEYNGAVIAINVTPEGFDYAVSGSPSSPATGDITLANGAANATISAALTVGTAGRVTFKSASGGTLWVPSAGSLNQWDGIQPRDKPQVDGSGPVHVFYDGEEQILTNWQSVRVTQPAVLSGNYPAFMQADFSPSLVWGLPVASEAGDPIPICWNAGNYGDCTKATVKGSLSGNGEKYASYGEVTFGFSGAAFDLTAINSSRAVSSFNISAASSEYVNEEYVDDHGWSHVYCASCPPTVYTNAFGQVVNQGNVGRCYVRHKRWVTDWQIDHSDLNESKGGTSALILFAQEREAVAGFNIQTFASSGTQRTVRGWVRTSSEEMKEPVGSPEDLATPFIDQKYDQFAVTTGPVTSDFVAALSDSTQNGSFHMRMSGGISYSNNLRFEDGELASADLFDFSFWVKNTHETANSTILAMRGGLMYDDPNLSPVNQKQNYVFHVDGDFLVNGGFADPAGMGTIAFIGQA